MALAAIALGWSAPTSSAHPVTSASPVGSASRDSPVAQLPRQVDEQPEQLSAADAVILGLVEGITEYLPISSTGHLVVTERLLDLGTTEPSKAAIDSYTVIIQFGAILAVLLLYRKRVADVLLGIVGRSETGRRLLVALLVAFVPFGIVGFLFNEKVDEHLLEPVPIAIAWIVGGLAILLLIDRLRRNATVGTALDEITVRQAAIIGIVQVLALWPGVSRSLVTIVAALLVGLRLVAAVEFSFLLGLVTLGSASIFSAARDGSAVVDAYGLAMPALGVAVAALSAAAAVASLVAYLNRRDLKVFGWYRLAVGVATLALVATNVI